MNSKGETHISFRFIERDRLVGRRPAGGWLTKQIILPYQLNRATLILQS